MLWARRHSDEDSPDLIVRLAKGDAQALDLIYRAEASEVYRFALAMCGNPAWSADAVQDAFVHLAEGPSGYDRAKGPLRAYLCGIARHKLRARWREAFAHSGHPGREDDDGDAETLDPSETASSPEYEFKRAQDTQALWRAVAALPWAFREAVVLVDLQERPYAEAAQIAGIELNTLRTRLHRARQRLAQALAPQYGDIPT